MDGNPSKRPSINFIMNLMKIIDKYVNRIPLSKINQEISDESKKINDASIKKAEIIDYNKVKLTEPIFSNFVSSNASLATSS